MVYGQYVRVSAEINSHACSSVVVYTVLARRPQAGPEGRWDPVSRTWWNRGALMVI